MLKKERYNSFSTCLLAREAKKRGIEVEKIFPNTGLSYLLLKNKNKIETIIGQRISSISYNAHFICKNKEMTRFFLRKNGIKTVGGKMFFKSELSRALEYLERIGYPVVIKPVDGTWGKNVFLNIRNKKEAIKKIKIIIKEKNKFLIEQQFKGKEYRILATREKLLGIIHRIPANIIGNGKHTIKELIQIKNQDKRRGEKHEKSLVKIKIDDEIKNNLREQKMSLETIPLKNQQIFLRKNSNLSTGGDSLDVTDEAHPYIKKLAPQVIASIPGLPYAGFDFLISDIKNNPQKVGYAIIEINDSPMLSMHHIPYQGKKRNVAKEIISLIFPENK